VSNVYEIELKLTNNNTGEVKTVTMREHAYSVHDAVMQALFNQNAADPGSAEITVVHVGPPAAEIFASASKLSGEIAGRMAGILEVVKLKRPRR